MSDKEASRLSVETSVMNMYTFWSGVIILFVSWLYGGRTAEVVPTILTALF